MIDEMQKTTGLVLSGGGARGFAHIGVLKSLARNNVKIDVISGSSMGGIIAALFALGKSPLEIEQLASQFSSVRKLVSLLDPAPARRGFLEGNRVREFLSELFPQDINIEDLKIPLSLAAVDLISKEVISMNSGPLLPAILATCAFPGLFPPVMLGPYCLVDGGVLRNLPVENARDLGASFLIAVDVQTGISPIPATENENTIGPLIVPRFFWDFYQAELIMVEHLTRYQLEKSKPDVVIHPPIPQDITMFLGFPRVVEIIEIGEKAADQSMNLIFQYENEMDGSE